MKSILETWFSKKLGQDQDILKYQREKEADPKALEKGIKIAKKHQI